MATNIQKYTIQVESVQRRATPLERAGIIQVYKIKIRCLQCQHISQLEDIHRKICKKRYCLKVRWHFFSIHELPLDVVTREITWSVLPIASLKPTCASIYIPYSSAHLVENNQKDNTIYGLWTKNKSFIFLPAPAPLLFFSSLIAFFSSFLECGKFNSSNITSNCQ